MQFTKGALKHENIVLHTKAILCQNYCYITDALTGILALMKRGEAGEAYNVCHDEGLVLSRKHCSIEWQPHASNNKSKVVFDIPEDVQGVRLCTDSTYVLSSKKLKSLGWKP